MYIKVSRLTGDALVSIYNKQGDLIHTESFSGNLSGNGSYHRSIPVSDVEFGHSTSLQFGPFEYKVIT